MVTNLKAIHFRDNIQNNSDDPSPTILENDATLGLQVGILHNTY